MIAILVMFLCGWAILTNLGNWEAKSPGQILLALVVFIGACAVATCGALS
jgi:Trk-type K+ transport system membrane component